MITLTPEQERKVKTLAQRRQKPTEAVLDELLNIPIEIAEEMKTAALLADEGDDENVRPLFDTLSDEEFEKEMDALAEIGRDWGSVPASAFDRDLIYEDRL